jgi:hypothetical protein
MRTEMYIDLDERRVANAAEAVDLTGLDDENVTGAGLEFLPVDDPEAPALPHELNFIVRMTMGPGTTPWEGVEEEDGDIDVAVLGSDEVVRAALKWQVLLPDTVHPAHAPAIKVAASRISRSLLAGHIPDDLPMELAGHITDLRIRIAPP